DAWQVLQRLRGEMPPYEPIGDDRKEPPADPARERDLIRRFVRQISLNHLLVGSAYQGIGGAGAIGGEPVTDGHGLPGDGGRSGGNTGYSGRQPVQLMIAKPVPDLKVAKRRPVIALLDSGIAEHDWFTWADREPGKPWPEDAQFLISGDAQKAVK